MFARRVVVALVLEHTQSHDQLLPGLFGLYDFIDKAALRGDIGRSKHRSEFLDLLPPEIFRPAVGRYIKTFGEGTADSPDFYRVIGEETATPGLTETFRSFVEQKGVPFLDVAVDCGTNGEARIVVNQNRYRPLGSPIADSDQMWNIPFCFSSDNGAHFSAFRKLQKTL